MDKDYSIFGKSSNLEKNVFYKEIDGKSFMPLDIINELIQEKEFFTVEKNTRAFLYPEEGQYYEIKEYSVCYNLRLKNKYIGRLIIWGPYLRMESEGMLQYADAIGSFLQDIIEMESDYTDRAMNKAEFYRQIKRLLSGEVFNEGQLNSFLRYKNWKINDVYQVTKVEFINDVSTVFYCSQLEKLLPEFIALAVDNVIYGIRNFSKCKIKMQHEENNFPVFLRESLSMAGISNLCYGISQIRNGRMEADIALEIGRRKKPEIWIHVFENYMMDYIADIIGGELPVNRLCHPAILILMNYDKTHKSEFVNTLKMYLQYQGNATYTANALYIWYMMQNRIMNMKATVC